jgi:hypothetical protein
MTNIVKFPRPTAKARKRAKALDVAKGNAPIEPKRYKVTKAGGMFYRIMEWRELAPRATGKRKVRVVIRYGWVCIAIGNKHPLRDIALRLNLMP